jgi:REP element-mobilizing transposase RayT
MTTARSEIVDVNLTRWYHCISKCVRSAFLMADDAGNDRKQWIEDRLQLLAQNFAVAVGGFAVMDNHLHVLCRLDPHLSQEWTAEETVRRWMAVYPPRELDLDDPKIVNMWVEHQAKDDKLVATYRERLSNLGWFMKALKEPLSRLCNRADGVKGTFWEARYKSIAILDTEALLATCAYIDLNPVAAGIAEVPEKSEHTSIRQRVEHARQCDKLEALKAARLGSVAGCRAAGAFEEDHWLVPLQDRRQITGSRRGPVREGMLNSFSLGSYLLLVEYTGRLFRNGKARISDGVKDVLDRLGTSVEFWGERIKKMMVSRDLRGCCFGCKPESLTDFAAHRGKRQSNLSPQLSAS